MHALITILNLFIIEVMLSLDNATILAIMVSDLPDRERPKALRYGILGAYLMRGTLLFCASWLISFEWLKIVGALYLLYLVWKHFMSEEEEEQVPQADWLSRLTYKMGFSRVWMAVVMVEVMDLVFSLDNIFSSVAISHVFWIVILGVGMGIFAMRFVATLFVKLIARFPTLEHSAFMAIGLVAIKMMLSGVLAYIPVPLMIEQTLNSERFDLYFSGIMMVLFLLPLVLDRKQKLSPVIE